VTGVDRGREQRREVLEAGLAAWPGYAAGDEQWPDGYDEHGPDDQREAGWDDDEERDE
jgi:hypothetical protein